MLPLGLMPVLNAMNSTDGLLNDNFNGRRNFFNKSSYGLLVPFIDPNMLFLNRLGSYGPKALLQEGDLSRTQQHNHSIAEII